MKQFIQIREEFLAEGKISIAKLKKGDKVQLRFKGSDAKRQGFKKDENPYGEGNKILILGFGNVKFKTKATASDAKFNSIADFKTKWKEELKANIRNHPSLEDARDWENNLYPFDSTGKLTRNVNRLINQSNGAGTSTGKKLKMPAGWTCFIYKVLSGDDKGEISYIHISHNDYWAKYWHTDTEFWLES